MQIELSHASQAKLEDVIEELHTRYDLEELAPEELVDALLDVGVDLIMAEELSMQMLRDRLLTYCGRKVAAR